MIWLLVHQQLMAMGYWFYPEVPFADGEKFIRYNAAGLGWLTEHLRQWGMDEQDVTVIEESCWKTIPKEICLKVADLMEANLPSEPSEYIEAFGRDVKRWRESGGLRVEG